MIERATRTLGADHPTTLIARVNHALDQPDAKSGGLWQPRAVIVGALGVVLGADHPLTAAATARIRVDCDIDPLPL